MDKLASPDVRAFPDTETMGIAVADEIAQVVIDSVASRGLCTVALSGGSTPAPAYGILAERYGGKLPWAKVHLFWDDERWVAKQSVDSNYGTAYRTLISRIPIPTENTHPAPVEAGTPEGVARGYERVIRSIVPAGKPGGAPAFDLLLLGIGADGHTASLFPGDPALLEADRLVLPVVAPAGVVPAHRITFTLPVINASRRVLFLVAGVDKRTAFQEIHRGTNCVSTYPAAMVRPVGAITWFVDEAVASSGEGLHER